MSDKDRQKKNRQRKDKKNQAMREAESAGDATEMSDYTSRRDFIKQTSASAGAMLAVSFRAGA